MFIRRLEDCKEIIANDGTRLRELLNPANEDNDLKMGYSIAHAIVESESSSIPHVIKGASEVYFILQGSGIMHIDAETSIVSSGDTIYIPPDTVQYIENPNDSPLVFLCMVYPEWKPERDEVVSLE